MFRLVRFFVLTSAVTAAAIAIAMFFYRLGEVRRLVAFAEQQNVELARSFPTQDGAVLSTAFGDEVSRPFEIQLYIEFPEAIEPELFTIRLQ
jgi:hypothetical protein